GNREHPGAALLGHLRQRIGTGDMERDARAFARPLLEQKRHRRSQRPAAVAAHDEAEAARGRERQRERGMLNLEGGRRIHRVSPSKEPPEAAAALSFGLEGKTVRRCRGACPAARVTTSASPVPGWHGGGGALRVRKR